MADDQVKEDPGRGQEEVVALRQRVLLLSHQLEEVNKDLEALNYSISHDLRAPLRSIEGFSQVLLEDYEAVLDSTGQDYLRRVVSGARRMTDMIDGLLQLSRLGRSEMHSEQVDLTRMAQAVVARLRAMDPQRQVECDIQEEVWGNGDRDLLRVVVDNLFSNAWKFTSRRRQARIEFGMALDGGRPVYFVRDDGVGFDMAYAGKIFAPFQRLHQPSEFPGQGIGLALVQRAIHRHGGRLWAEAAVEQGATFRFTL